MHSTDPAAARPAPASKHGELLLDVRNLQTHFETRDATRRAVDGVSFALPPERTLGLVGESGCGKSVTSLSIMRLVPDPPGRVVGGEIIYRGRDLLKLSEREMRGIRGAKISMIFQEPMTSLNPVYTIGSQVAEVFQIHRDMGRREAFGEAVGMLERVHIPDAARRAREYPHQMSGGMRQRVMIAMALACNPDLLIADEPTTALDVTVQAQILMLMNELRSKFGTSILMITHDLGVIAETSDDVAVMYAGQIAEMAPTREIFARPLHPYTQGLMRSIPRIDEIREGRKLRPIGGSVPDPAAFPGGCRFNPRCPFVRERCRVEPPELLEAGDNHRARCHFWREIAEDPEAAHAAAEPATEANHATA